MEVLACRREPVTGRADVVMRPVEVGVVEKGFVEEGSGGLHYVKGRVVDDEGDDEGDEEGDDEGGDEGNEAADDAEGEDE